ncbi:MAG: ABC transporter substrate-binding protein [Elusimicrobiota bacterium]|nr:ABC transporter substrate-binding protein [Elusimicrobiota bacterium]
MRTLLLAVLLGGGASGARAQELAPATKAETLLYAHMGEIITLDPVYPYDAVTQGMLLNVYETLIRFSGSSLTAFEPLLASKVPSTQNGLASADGLTFKFPVRKGVKFHGGGQLTPEDVKYSLLRFMFTDPTGGPASLLLEPVFGLASSRGADGRPAVTKAEFDGAVKVQGENVVVRLKRPFAPFLSIMARWSYVMDKKWCVSRGEWDGAYETILSFSGRPKEKSGLFNASNGTGPFLVARWDSNTKQAALSASPHYWGRPPRLKRVIMKTVQEFGTRRLMLEAGDADIIDLPRPFEPQVRGLKGVALYDDLPRLMTDPVFFFTFNVNAVANPDIGSGKLDGEGVPPDFFSNLDVRKAFSYSFDYNGYLKEGLKGKAARAKGSIPPGIAGYNPATPGYEFSRTRADEYFRKAYNGAVWNKGFRFTLTYNTGGDVRQLACEVLKRGVEAINPRFHVDLRGVDWPVYLEKTQNRKMPLFTRGWTGDYPDAHNFIFPFYHSKGRYAIAQAYSNPALDRQIEAAVTETSPAKRAAMYAGIQRAAYEDAVQIYTVHPRGLYATRDTLKGFYDNAVFMGIYFYPLSK